MCRRGSSGDEVRKIQSRLSELKLFQGAVDGIYCDKTEAAVRSFQSSRSIAADGVAGPATLALLFQGAPQATASEMASRPLAYRCLALTGTFETSRVPPGCFCGVAGNFDGQGLSFGALQWNLGQKTLQPLLAAMLSEHPKVCQEIFGKRIGDLQKMLGGSLKEQMEFAASVQDSRFRINESWKNTFQSLGSTPECRALQVRFSADIYRRAGRLVVDYGLTTERGLALMFDLCVQNGSIGAAVRQDILSDFQGISGAAPEIVQVERMRMIARRRAAAARPQFASAVLKRKLTIAEGKGLVNGISIDLEQQYGLRLAVSQETLAA